MQCQLDQHTLDLNEPVATAAGVIRQRTVWVLMIDDGAGNLGLGEAAPLPGYGGEDPERCVRTLSECLGLMSEELITGWVERGRPDASLGRMEKLLAETPCARHAIEGALNDLMAQVAGKPLSQILAERPVSELPVNALLSATAPEVAAAEARGWLTQGYRCIKIKVGSGSVKEDLVRVYAVRGAVGPDARLRVDGNGRWTFDSALEFLTGARDAKLEFCEQPLSSEALGGLATLRKRTGVPLAVDETVRQPGDVARVVAEQAADVIVLKPMFLGGWRPTKQAGELAKSSGLGAVITTSLDGSIGRAAATHMAAALGLQERAHGLATGRLLKQDLTSAPLVPSAGTIRINDKPGLGIGKKV